MSLTIESTRARIGYLSVFGGFLMLIDTLWGAIAVLPFDWYRPSDITVGISFVMGLPAYILDSWSKKRIIIFLPALLVFRWLALSLLAKPPTLIGPWRVNVLIIVASILLQWSKLRKPA